MSGQKPGPVHLLPIRLNKAARLIALETLIEALEVYCINYGNGDGSWYVDKVLVDPASLKAGIEKSDFPTMEDVDEALPLVRWLDEDQPDSPGPLPEVPVSDPRLHLD